MRTVVALLILALAAGLTGCSRRERSNPFDPRNPETRGRPSSFVAEARNALVVLRWRDPGTIDLVGYRLERRVEGDSVFVVIADQLPAGTTSIGDFGLANGKRHHYRLAYVFEAGVSSLAAEDHATPGPMRPWITDLGSGELLQLSADGRRVVGADAGFVSPAHLAVDRTQGRVWVADSYTGDITIVANDIRTVVTSLVLPAGIAVDPIRHTSWVCDERLREVAHFLSNGEHATPPRIGPFELPLDVAIDPGDGTIWVADHGAGRVHAFHGNGVERFRASVPQPSRIAIDSLTHEAWVTSFERGLVVRVSAAGIVTDTVGGLRGPIGVAVDGRRGRIWVTDAIANEVVTIDRGARIERRMRGHVQAREVDIDLATGNAWVIATGEGRMVVLSPEGVEVDALGGLDQPYDIALDPGRTSVGFGLTGTAPASAHPPVRPR